MNANIEDAASPEGVSEVRALLDATPLFSGLGDAVLADLSSHASVRWLRTKETLYLQGQPGDYVFVLVVGSM